MDILNNKTDLELYQTLVAELAKSTHEIRCAQADVAKAHNRLNFLLAVANHLINRKED